MKKMELYSTPPILMMSLKRFKSGRGSYFKDKLEDKVYFPIDTLDVSNIVLSNKNADGTNKKDIHYELYAVSNHYGAMGFGHYTAYAKNPLDNNWYDFDDSNVTLVTNVENIITDAAYNLFYRRKDFDFADYSNTPRNAVDFEEFKIEVSHYKEPKVVEESKASGDAEMADV
jgi:ubiquitin carboxyl-terminal hydrolase 4/11/15